MSVDFSAFYTRAGLAALRNASADGLQAQIVALAIGAGEIPVGGGDHVGYAPTGDETALKSEIARAPILSAVPFGTAGGGGPIGFTLESVFPRLPAGAPPATIRELGVFLADGTLLAVWSRPGDDGVMGETTALSALVLSYDLWLSALPASSLTVTVQSVGDPDNLACLAQLLRGVARNTTRELLATYRLARRGIRD